MSVVGSSLVHVHVQPSRRRALIAALRRAWSLHQTPASTRRHGLGR